MYPTVTAEQLRTYADTICIICREEMTGDNQVKKLPCDHIFHKNCLRSWFQRQQTCPTCRTQVLRLNPVPHLNNVPIVNPPQQQPQHVPQAPAPPHQQAQHQPPVFNQPQPQQQQQAGASSVHDLPQQPPLTPLLNPAQLFSAIGQSNIMPPFSKSSFLKKFLVYSSFILLFQCFLLLRCQI